MYVSRFPCNECAKLIIESDIKEVVFAYNEKPNRADVLASKKMLMKAKIKLR